MKNKQFTNQQILDLLTEAESFTGSTSEFCRTKGIKEPTFYAWKKKFKGTTTPDQQRLKQLERDQDRLLKLVGKLQLENDAMKDLIRMSWPKQHLAG